MYDEIIEIAENRAYLNAVRNEAFGPNTEFLKLMPRYEDLHWYEEELRAQNALTFNRIFHEPIGYYMLKCFLISDYSVDKAVFISDVELYKKIRDPSARLKVAKFMMERYVAEDTEKFQQGQSVFEHTQPKSRRRSNYPKSAEEQSQDLAASDALLAMIDPSGAAARRLEQEKAKNTSAGGAAAKQEEDAKRPPLSLQIGKTNAIGVYGSSVADCIARISNNESARDLFDGVAQEVLNDLRMDVFPRFEKSKFFQRYIQAKYLERKEVNVKDFTTLRMLGRGAFGAVNAVVKKDTGILYASKCIDKKRVMATDAVDNIMSERNLLSLMENRFVCCLKYAVMDNDTLYLMLDLMMGGDLKFHLNREERFPEARSRFHAAEVLIGLEHIHSKSTIYRDMKLENVLLDEKGHCRISDLGLAVMTKDKVKGYAGTPGYTAPEVILMQPYNKMCDFFSYGVMIYRFLSGRKPFGAHTGSSDLDKNVLNVEADYPQEYFSPSAVSLLKGLMDKDPTTRLGSRGVEEIKNHPWFDPIDWGLLEAGYLTPPFVPKLDEVNADSLKHMGRPHNDEKYRKVRLTEEFQKSLEKFPFKSTTVLQTEIVEVLQKADEGVNFEKFAPQPAREVQVAPEPTKSSCCVIT